jgi:hypothetical protein
LIENQITGAMPAGGKRRGACHPKWEQGVLRNQPRNGAQKGDRSVVAA